MTAADDQFPLDFGTSPSGESVGYTRTSLLRKAQSSSADVFAWRRVVHLYGPLVYGWCRRKGLQPHDAADVVQQVFEVLARRIGTFRKRSPNDSFRAWLHTISSNKIRDHARELQRRREVAAGSLDACVRVDDAPAESSTNAAPDMQALLGRALAYIRPEFSETTWRAFWEVTAFGRRPADVAADLAISTNSVYIAKSRVLGRIRAEFADLFDVGSP